MRKEALYVIIPASFLSFLFFFFSLPSLCSFDKSGILHRATGSPLGGGRVGVSFQRSVANSAFAVSLWFNHSKFLTLLVYAGKSLHPMAVDLDRCSETWRRKIENLGRFIMLITVMITLFI